MKVIDIMYKIANGEEVPKKIIYEDEIYSFRKDLNDYQNEYGTYADDITHFKYLFENPYGADYKKFFNEEVEATEEDYDRNVEQLLYDKINAEQEVERLNNIINELENYIKVELKNVIPMWNLETHYSFGESTIYEYILNKLQELKGSEKE